MKKYISVICLLGTLLLMLSGCGGSEPTYCTDESILSKLKNDDTPEFVLDGAYYTLPARAGDFFDNGWEMTTDKYNVQDVTLQPGERIDVTLAKDGFTFSAVLVNDSPLPLNAGEDCQIIQIYLYLQEGKLNPDYFVTKCGITGETSLRDIKAALQDREGFSEASNRCCLSVMGDLVALDILNIGKQTGNTSITIESASVFDYRGYKSMEEKAQEQAENIAAYKAEAEEKSLEDYAQIVDELNANSNRIFTVPFCSVNGTVLVKGTGNYEGTEDKPILGEDLSLFVVQDSSGQVYCILEGYADHDRTLKLPELEEGDVIALWGFASKITIFEDGSEVPTVVPKIVEKDGELIYLAEDLQAK